MKNKIIKKKSNSFPVVADNPLLSDVRLLIESARERIASTVNAELTTLYWQVGVRIHKEILKNKRAQYGEVILPTLSTKLTLEYGRGFSEKNLRHMVRFAEVFPDEKIVSALRRQLGWTHFNPEFATGRGIRRTMSCIALAF